MSRVQEHLHLVTEISQEELYILDPELVSKETVGTSPGMPDLVGPEGPDRRFNFPDSPRSSSATARPSESDSELIDCIETRDLNRLTELHLQGADLTLQDSAGCSLLHRAVMAGDTEVLKYLLQHVPTSHLDITEKETGETALHKAVSSSQRTICHLLVEAGASLTKTDLQGETPRQRAENNKNPELTEYLEKRQIQREDQETPV
ncbi:hypothetical protein CesoFtcFv8_006879 [Champsocephalus esox]|uniref:Uncharacterized protein n=1 Tax=Champsocephalus esox TaxID=159716 RepID=A0AAN8H3M5_9TELE|nr:hypothetical protein CesoFtcFv8_006879 [Champsocephalus esox]